MGLKKYLIWGVIIAEIVAFLELLSYIFLRLVDVNSNIINIFYKILIFPFFTYSQLSEFLFKISGGIITLDAGFATLFFFPIYMFLIGLLFGWIVYKIKSKQEISTQL